MFARRFPDFWHRARVVAERVRVKCLARLEPFAADGTVGVFWLRALFSRAETASLIRLAEMSKFDTEPDSTDLLPSHELYLLQRGRPKDPAWAAVDKRIEDAIAGSRVRATGRAMLV